MPKIPLRRALLWAPCLFLLAASALAGGNCPLDGFDEIVTVDKIFDGDTLRLTDGRRLRLIGVNTPEGKHRGRNAEPLAAEATRLLRKLAPPGSRLKLRRGWQERDRYGRLLAHAISMDGINLSRRLLREGLGAAVHIAPNFQALDCYLAAEKQARAQGRGIWGHPYFTPLDARRLPADAGGFHFVRGTLTRIGTGKQALWLNLGEDFALRIRHRDRRYFRELDFDTLPGRIVVARGWIYAVRGRWRMNLYHPASLEIEPAATETNPE